MDNSNYRYKDFIRMLLYVPSQASQPVHLLLIADMIRLEQLLENEQSSSKLLF